MISGSKAGNHAFIRGEKQVPGLEPEQRLSTFPEVRRVPQYARDGESPRSRYRRRRCSFTDSQRWNRTHDTVPIHLRDPATALS